MFYATLWCGNDCVLMYFCFNDSWRLADIKIPGWSDRLVNLTTSIQVGRIFTARPVTVVR